MNPTQLAGLVRNVYPNFDMNNFDDRLKLQKLVYLMGASKINLGYNFRLYLHGPYCTQLARDGFEMPNFDECDTLRFEKKDIEELFINMNDFLEGVKDNPGSMEILASLHLFHKLFPDKGDEEIIKMVEEKSPKFAGKTQEIQNLLNKIKSFQGIEW